MHSDHCRLSYILVALISLVAIACSQPSPAVNIQPVEPATELEPLYTLQGIVFHDYNGDGIKQNGEPAIPEVDVDLITQELPPKAVLDSYQVNTVSFLANGENVTAYSIQMTADLKGFYSIQAPAGDYKLAVNRNMILGCNDRPFRYISISIVEYKPIADWLCVSINQDLMFDIALMQGCLTLPFSRDTKFRGKNEFGIESFADLDNADGHVRNWKGNTGQTYDRHTGTDYYMEQNTPILTAAPGVVIDTGLLDPSRGYGVLVQHECPYYKFKNLSTGYGHLNKVNVKVGDKVNRGDVLGLSGRVISIMPSFYNGEHLHLDVLLLNGWDSFPYSLDGYYTDPYRNVSDKGIHTAGYWTKDNDPQYP